MSSILNPDDNITEAVEPAEFLEDERPGVAYVKPKLEMVLSQEKKNQCREIVKEICDFGVNQRQILYIIDLLALRVENNEHMKEIRNAVSKSRDEMTEAENKPGLLLLGNSILGR